MTAPAISVICPTVPGREESLERCLTAYRERSTGVDLEIIVIRDVTTCGEGWINGAELAEGDYLHFTADDLEPWESWWQHAVETCDQGQLPAPVVYLPDGNVQSAGGDMNEPNCLRSWIGHDREPVPFTPVPFLSREQWDRIGMIPVHYFSDVWVSERGRRLGIETVLRTYYRLTHHNEPSGRRGGQWQRDLAIYQHEITAEVPA